MTHGGSQKPPVGGRLGRWLSVLQGVEGWLWPPPSKVAGHLDPWVHFDSFVQSFRKTISPISLRLTLIVPRLDLI
ncbi:unnamed protein product [Rhodiola kirilowii]